MADPKEWPILFSGEMVKAILAAKKTQTRRLSATWDRVQPGDLLWVRETFAMSQALDDQRLTPEMAHQGWPRWYAAGGEVWPGARDGGPAFVTRGRWRPSIHMVRWAARITLRAVRVRVEPLQQISAADCEAEGIVVPPVDYTVPEDPRVLDFEREEELRRQYRELWIKLNGAASWDSNPEVRVVEFSVEAVDRG